MLADWRCSLLAGALLFSRAIGDVHRDIAALAMNQALTQRVADALQLTRDFSVAGAQMNLDVAGLTLDHDFDRAHGRRIETNDRMLAALSDLQLQPVAQRDLERRALQFSGCAAWVVETGTNTPGCWLNPWTSAWAKPALTSDGS